MSDNKPNKDQSTQAPVTANKATDARPIEKTRDPVRQWTFMTLFAVLLLLVWYLVSDRVAPFTSQARVHALVVPIAPEVSGTVLSVSVGTNQRVKAGQELFQIDPERYRLAVETAEADLQSARQSMGASSASVTAAEASVVSAQANLVRSEKDAVRLQRIKDEDPGAISQRRIESAEASLAAARGQLDAANANVEKAKQDLGQTGEQNSRILQAQSALSQAKLNLQRTMVVAPETGLVTDVRVSKGNFANASAPQMTFVAVDKVWIRADFTENNLGHIKVGNKVKIVFDVLPGKVYPGTVRELGFGVAVDSAPLGSLPTINNNQGWLRAAQRYPVLVDFDLRGQPDTANLRVGAQASVLVMTGDNTLINSLAGLQIWLSSKLTYAY